MPFTKYETILFDIDDTLFDFKATEYAALHNTFMEYDLPNGFSDYHGSYKEISKILWEDLEQGKIALKELGVERFKRLFLKHELETDAGLFSESYLGYLGQEMHLMPGAVEVLAGLTHCRLAIITNGFGEVQKARIANSPISSHFEQIIISEETGFQKPHHGIFDYAFSKLKLSSKEKVLMVGDSLTSDIRGGNNYGIDTVWFNPENKENLAGVRPTYEISDLLELADIVNGNK